MSGAPDDNETYLARRLAGELFLLTEHGDRVDFGRDEASIFAEIIAQFVQAEISQALTASGYRLVAPGEMDPETKERCAKVAVAEIMRFRAKVNRRYYAGYHEDMRDAVDAAIRAEGKP